MKIKRCVIALFLALSLLFCGCESRVYKVSNIYFDTFIELTAFGQEVPQEALEICKKYDKLLSVTNQDSDIYKLNRLGQYEVQRETLEIIKTALSYCEESMGLFDISVYPLSSLWDFKSDNPSLPHSNDISEALKSVDYKKIKIDGNTVTLPQGGGIDLGGIAKGYIADKIAEIYEEHSLSGIINLGGNILTVGSKPKGEAFKVGIKKPFSQNETACYLDLQGGSAVTCGIYERAFNLDGKIYHHILNPKTGYPQENGLHSVTVVSQNSTQADALSTTLFLMGEEKAMEYLKEHNDVHGVFIRSDGTIVTSHGLEKRGNTIKIK